MKKSIVLLSLACSLSLHAKVKLSPLFTNNMVLQQQSTVALWGEAKAGKKIQIVTSWDGRRYQTRTNAAGQWRVEVTTPRVGGPFNISISDGDVVQLKDVLIGEVWLCSGQSNMEMPMQGWDVKMNEEEIARSARYKQVRLLQLDEVTSPKPESNFTARNGGWMTSQPETVKDFSATAFFFGKHLSDSLNVPIGLIMTCWGGTPIEAWMSGESLARVEPFAQTIADMAKVPTDKQARVALYQSQLKAWQQKMAARVGSFDSKGRCVFAQPNYDDSAWQTMTLPTQIEKAGLANYDGYVWFRRVVDIPAAWAGKDLELHLSMIDDNDITFFNGEEIGRTEGFNQKRVYKVPARWVKAGKAVITVCCEDNGGEGGIWGEASDMRLAPVGIAEGMSLAGDWHFNATTNLYKVEPRPMDYSRSSSIPSVLFNSMINPLTSYPIAGAIWYQGEANVGRAAQYAKLLPTMIADWRQRWGKPFPFYIAQLANFMQRHPQPVESDWAALREAQRLTANQVGGAALQVNIDIGNPANIHPTTKAETGRRLSLLAQALTYNNKVEWSGPQLESFTLEGASIRLRFSHTTGGLRTTDGKPLTGFAIGGADGRYHWANASIEGNTIVVSSPDVPLPVSVRYAWDEDPAGNLTTASHLPASPFSTANEMR